MITEPTVLVLGAGASMHLNYPSGSALVDKVVDSLHDKEFFARLDFTGDHIDSFRSELKLSGKNSVDAFLEHRNEYINLGKHAISKVLIPYENKDKLFQRENNWYEYIFNKLNASFEEFGKNNISIITFNYDRSIEEYLFTALKNSHGKKETEVANIINQIQIIHVHGQLSHLPWQNTNCRPYSNTIDIDRCRGSASMIKIIHESIKDDEEFILAQELLSNAANIYFLGFGYHEINMTRLRLLWSGHQRIFGSCLGFTQLERKDLQNKYNGELNLVNPSYDVLDFFRECVSLK